MQNIQERRKTLETLLQQKLAQIQQIDAQKNEIITDAVKLQGKLDLLKELENEVEIKPETKNG